MKEERILRAIVGKAGGNAGANSLNYKVSIPSAWANALELSAENRELLITFDGKKITIQRPKE